MKSTAINDFKNSILELDFSNTFAQNDLYHLIKIQVDGEVYLQGFAFADHIYSQLN